MVSAFADKVRDGTCDAFYVRTNKDLTINERKTIVLGARMRFEESRNANPDLNAFEVKMLLVKENLQALRHIGRWKDKWVLHPSPDKSEPQKAMCCLTDTGKHDDDDLARLHVRASLHAIDRFFMRIRRKINPLERAIGTASNRRRLWYGYNPYNPAVAAKLLAIYRVVHNYVPDRRQGNKPTPAMQLGLAKGPVKLEDIIYFRHAPEAPPSALDVKRDLEAVVASGKLSLEA
jgi:hypothetical protein